MLKRVILFWVGFATGVAYAEMPAVSGGASFDTSPLQGDAAALIGTWTLVKHGFVDLDGHFTPTALEMRGQLIYTTEGSMSILITKRPNAEKLEELIVYSGDYSLKEGKLLHHIRIAPSAKRVGTTEIRLMTLARDLLVLRTPPSPDGHYEITWKRLK